MDAGPGDRGGAAGARGRGAAPRGLQGGGRRAGRVAHRAGLPHAVPRARAGPVLPARDVRRRALRSRARRRRRGVPLGRRHTARRRLGHISPDGVGQGLQRRRAGARGAGDLLPGGRLQRRRHAWHGVRVGGDGAERGEDRGELPRRAASGHELPRRPRVAAGVLRPGARQRVDGRRDVAPRRRPAPRRQREGHGPRGDAGRARPRSQGRGEGADVPDHRGAGRGRVGAVVGAQLRRHVAGARRVHALADHRHHQPQQPRQRARRAVLGVRRGPTGAAVPQHGQDRACAGVHRVKRPARRRPAARAPRQPLRWGRVHRHVLRLRLCLALVPRRHKLVRECTANGKKSSLLHPASRSPCSLFCSPIFAEIVPEKARTTVYAMDRCFESVFASFAPPLVGILAERVFGYQPAKSGTSVEADRENAAALGKAVFAEIAVPFAVCCLTYTGLYWTYPADRQHAQTAALQAPGEQDCDCEASLVAHAAGPEGLNQALLAGTRTE